MMYIADLCAGYSTGAGYGSECDGLVTDGSCAQTCTAGYTGDGNGQHTCANGSFAGAVLTCTGTLTCSGMGWLKSAL